MYGRTLLLKAKYSPVFGPAYEVAKRVHRRVTVQGMSLVDVINSFPMYRPNSGGSYRMLAPLTIGAVNDTMPALARLLPAMDSQLSDPVPADEFARRNGRGRPDVLAERLDHYGSDKACDHDYHLVYASLLGSRDPNARLRILEVGLGTNNTDVVSNMGIKGRPGASIRAFRDFLPNAKVYGADIDTRILFSEDRIACFEVDQTDTGSLFALGHALGGDCDLMIDDGLHSPNANLNTLEFFLGHLKPGGAAVIEDIPQVALPLWQVVAALVPDRFEATIVQARSSLMFVCKRRL